MKRFLASAAFLLLAGTLLGQTNTTSSTAASYFWGQKAISRVDGSTSTHFWFRLDAVQGRCYCVEAGNFDGAYGDQNYDTYLRIFQSNGTTLITENDDAQEEPTGHFLSRACWVRSLPSQVIYVELHPNQATGPSSLVTLRFIDTTLFCNWFFIAGDYNAFSLIRNTSVTPLAGVVVTWRGLNGAVAGTTTVSIPGNGAVILNARDFVNPGIVSNGTVEIAHPGSPEQIWASTTTLSGTTGLGFDAQFGQRKTW